MVLNELYIATNMHKLSFVLVSQLRMLSSITYDLSSFTITIDPCLFGNNSNSRGEDSSSLSILGLFHDTEFII
jgi:hypothetical protein